MSSPEDRQVLIDELVQKYRKQLQEQLSEEAKTLDQIEEVAGRIGRRVSQDVQQHLAQKRAKSARQKRQDCPCGAQARYKGRQPRSIVTLHGVLRLHRAVYHCPTCQHSFAPADARLSLDAGSTTPCVRHDAAYLAALVPFAQAATTLALLSKVSLSAATIERIACAVGASLQKQQQEQVQAHHQDRLPQPDLKARRRLYIGMDGVFVPLRDAWKHDGSQGGLHCRFGECKVGVLYEPHQDPSGKDTKVAARAYTATLAPAEAFGPLLGTLAHQQGHHRCRDLVVLADGAPWIRQIAAKQFTGAVQIVDFFHASQHLALLAEARFGSDTEEAKAWLHARQDDLKNERLESVLTEILAWRARGEGKRQLRRTTYLYFVNNAHRMRYKTFLEKGYHIGSGVIEAGCKHLVTQRMKQAGMHWRQESAEAILTLRAAQLSTHPPDLRPHCALPV